ncbi:MAG: heat-inducible transcription repressor HrcA [Caldilineaceae bacterium]|nr:heat-inducible transcription repressor HrcA [Caldilineaceae bacterium]MCB0094607.1 heat-inducible transcription repressor HrcA [Caldilineaceae bacterium]MCB0144463.1 heat-inducible transcription repressor HrcA [Caldilineaceae bacterium]
MVNANLTERQQRLLNIVIQEYTRTAQPVSSKAIAETGNLGVSSATIRNDLAFLEQEGLLTHPHTSAGRMPTDAGYRYFVQNLMADAELPIAERKRIRQEFSSVRQELDQWLRLSTTVLANASQSAALATAPRSSQSRFKHVELVAIRDTKVLLVLVLQTGVVRQQLLDLDLPMDQSELNMASNELNDRFVGATSTAIQKLHNSLSPFAKQVSVLIVDIMERHDSMAHRHFFRDGLAQVLDAPEFAASDNVRRIVQVLEERTILDQVVDEYSSANEIQVIIAGEGRYHELQEISLVLSRYGVDDQATGMLGVVGPLRMSYGRNIGAVRFVAMLMSDMVQEIYGPTVDG